MQYLKSARSGMMQARRQLTAQPLRTFSNSIKPPTVNNTGAYIGMGLGIAGLGYLAYTSSAMSRNQQLYSQRGETFMSPIVQKRVANTFGFFGYGIGATGAICYGLRNSMAAANANPWVLLAASLGTLVATHMVDYHENFALKMAAYTGFIGLTGVTLVPLIQMTSMGIIADAALATGMSLSTLATVAYMAPSEQFLQWGGMLSLACGGMMAVSILGMLNPGSKALFNVWLYGGLALSGMLVMFRTQRIIHDAKTQYKYDPVNHAVGIYLDAVNMFVRFVMILQGNKKK